MEIIEISIEQNYSSQIPYSKGNEDGIAYAMYLRRVEKKKNPILFMSSNELEKVLNYPNSNIINAIGHSFLKIPKSDESEKEAIQDLNPLNDIQLSDIIINYCGVRSALSNTFHEFKNDIKATINKDLTDKEKAIDIKSTIEKYKSILVREYPDNSTLLKEYNRITGLFKENDLNSISHLLIDDKSLAMTILTEDEDISRGKKDFEWEVLLLDDNQIEVADVKKSLEDRGLKVHPAKSVEEAEMIIEKDETNRITVAISDYRLYKNPTAKIKIMQSAQGYDFLIELSQKNKFIAKVALSGLSKQFLMDSFRKYSVNVKVYSKTDLVNNGVNIFVDDIIEMGEAQLEVILHKPKGDAWENDIIKFTKTKNDVGNNNEKTPNSHSQKLIDYYRFHRNHKDYLSYETKINTIAESFAREMEYNLAKEASFSLESLVSLKGNCTKNLPKELENGYETFRIKLIQRRVVYYLLFKYLEQYPIYSLLQYGKIEPDLLNKPKTKREKITDKGSKTKKVQTPYDIIVNRLKPVGNFLAINAKSDIPQNLLVEELNFLEYVMGLPIRDVSQSMDQTYSYINDYVSDYLNSHPDLVDALTNKKDSKYSYLIQKDGIYRLCTISLRECSIALEIIFKHLKKNKENDLAEKIKEDIISMLQNINKLIPATIKNQLALETELKSLNEDKSNKILEKHFTRITDSFIKRINNLF